MKDHWSETAKGCIEGRKKRSAALSELDDFTKLVESQQPWQHVEELTPSTNMLPDEQQGTPTQDLKRVKNESGAQQPSTSSKRLPSPLPSPTKTDVQDREEYEKKMAGLIAMVHKVNGEWNRKGREFTIAVAKSSCNHLTAGSAVEAALQTAVKTGDEMVKIMDKVETDYAKAIDVDYKTQNEMKKNVDKVYDLIKSGNKLKLTMRGFCFTAMYVDYWSLKICFATLDRIRCPI